MVVDEVVPHVSDAAHVLKEMYRMAYSEEMEREIVLSLVRQGLAEREVEIPLGIREREEVPRIGR